MNTTPTLRIGTHCLGDRDIMLLRGLVKLNASTPQGAGWTFVDHAPFDLVFVDGDATPQATIAALELTAPTVKLAKSSAGNDPYLMQRPYSSESLLIWLDKARLHAVTRPARVPELERLASQAVNGMQGVVGAIALSIPSADTSAHFKLRKWPPTALLAGDPARIRMATMLAKQALKIKELALIAQQPVDSVVQFLNTLQATDLLLIGQPQMALAHASAAPAAHGKDSGTVRSFIGRLRLKLGF